VCEACKEAPPDETCDNCYKDKQGNVTELCDACFKKKLAKEKLRKLLGK